MSSPYHPNYRSLNGKPVRRSSSRLLRETNQHLRSVRLYLFALVVLLCLLILVSLGNWLILAYSLPGR